MFDKFREECGVFGIYGHPEAANMAYLGLYALQHRGQESAGIAVSDGVRVRALRAMGYVAEIFTQDALATLPGHIAIGHTRYSTAGESSVANAQPLLIDCVHGQVGICHNGNIVNARELRDELERQGSIFQTNSDTEVALHLYRPLQGAERRRRAGRGDLPAHRRLLVRVPHQGRLIAVRDPHGFRPLALGRLGDALGRVLRDLRVRPRRRHLRARHRARRGADHRARRAAVGAAVPAGAERALHLRARLLRAARQRGVRPERQRRAHRAGPAAGPRDRRRRPTSSCRSPTRASARPSATPSRRACRCAWA